MLENPLIENFINRNDDVEDVEDDDDDDDEAS